MTIDLAGIETIRQLHLLFKEKLNFQEGYGRNWDAFWDSLAYLDPRPEVIILKGWDELAKKFPRDSKILDEIILDYNKRFQESKFVKE